MSTKERMLAIRLMGHMTRQARFARTLGLQAAMTEAKTRENTGQGG